jgi:hypothetical protein
MSHVTESITYFAEEGRANLDECLRLSFLTAYQYGLEKVIIFTGIGDGVQRAVDEYSQQADYAQIKVIGVTFPQGFEVSKDGHRESHTFPEDRRSLFRQLGIPVVRAHLPFNPISMQYQHTGVLAQDPGIVGNALNIFCGSMSLCIQAVLIACDAGEVKIGEHVVVMTSDTALLVRAAPTARLLTDLIVRQIICKPAFLTIAKVEKTLPQEDGDHSPDPLELESETSATPSSE